jgi:hypothetical protein
MSKGYDYSVSPGLQKDARVAVVDRIRGLTGLSALKTGVRMGENFPPTAEVTLKKDRGGLLTDFLFNNEKVVPISEKARAFFESEGLDDTLVEYLPFVLIGKNGRPMKNACYCVANPLRMVDCLDREKSDFTAHDDGEVMFVDHLYVLPDEIPDDAIFFRLGEQPRYILFRSDFVQRIEQAGLTGLTLTPMGEEIW